uniref:Malectin-like domain-containing protein n=1 Tax=Tetraselmis chuii TaxID=63592 RepID=A0A7S1T2K8_9CHLO|mmetsp:Transcript_3841/g.7044  ORF Transcript_3841/g.7044 Transcript_3841/m.7044 type:complete len:459 (+) Transcript_3841:211-1587(+)
MKRPPALLPALLLILRQLSTGAGQSDLPIPRRCHLAVPCTSQLGCEPGTDSLERWVAGGDGVDVRLGVVCIDASGSRLYGTAGFFTYEIREEGSAEVLQEGKFNQFDVGLYAHVSPTLTLPLGAYSVTIKEGALENNRVPIANGRSYVLTAVTTAPPAPVVPSATTPNAVSSPNDSDSPAEPDGVRPGLDGEDAPQAAGGSPAAVATPVPPEGSSGQTEEAQPSGGENVTVIVLVAVLSVLAVSVFGTGVLCYVRGRDGGSPMKAFSRRPNAYAERPAKYKYSGDGGKDSSSCSLVDDGAHDLELGRGGSGSVVVHAQHRETTPQHLPQFKPSTAEGELLAQGGEVLAPPDFTAVSGPRRPGRGKRAKHSDEDHAILTGDVIRDASPPGAGPHLEGETGKPSVVAFGELMKLTEHLFSADEDVYRSPSSQPRTPGSVPLSNPLTPESGAFGRAPLAPP